MSSTPTQQMRSKWLTALLPDVVFDGWSEAATDKAAIVAGLSDGEKALAAPRGVIDLIEAFFDDAQAVAKASLDEMDMIDMRVPEKVKAGVLAWLDALDPHREAVRRAGMRGLTPWGATPAASRTWSVADMIWTAAGDTAEDYNRYTKRGLLAAVLPDIVMRWVDRPEPEELETLIDKRLKQASGLGRNAGKVAGPILSAAERLFPKVG